MSHEASEEERALVEALKRGEPAALERLVLSYQGQVYRLCLRVMKREVEAEDMAQETFLRACKAAHLFRGDSGLSTWLFKIALNVCRNRLEYLKRRRGAQHSSISELKGDRWQLKQPSADNPEERAVYDESQALLERALQGLSADHRLLLNLRDGEELSYQEIAEVTGWAEGTIKSKLHRARKQLAERYIALQSGEVDDESH